MFLQFLDMIKILHQSYWRDEAFSVLIAQHQPQQIISLIGKDQSPPLYFLILHYWVQLLGTSEASVRYLSLLIHVGIGIITFFIARKLFKSIFGQIAITLVVLFNPFLFQYAFEARPYGLLALLTAIGIYFIAQKKYFLASIPLALSLLTHNFGIFNLMAIGMWWLYMYRRTLLHEIKNTLSLFLLPILTFFGWSAVIWSQFGRVQHGFWIHSTTISMFMDAISRYTQGEIYYPLQETMYFWGMIFFIIGVSYWIWKKEKEEQLPILIGFVSSIPFLLTYIFSKMFFPLYHERYLMASVPLLILLIGYALTKLAQKNHVTKWIIIGISVFYIIFEIQTIRQISDIYTKPAINWGVSQVLAQAKPGDIIIPEDSLNFLEAKLYAQNNPKHIPVYVYSKDGTIPYFIGGVIFEKNEIVTKLPAHTHIWRIQQDGGYYLQVTK